MFGEEDNITHDVVESDFDISNWTELDLMEVKDLPSGVIFPYYDYEYEEDMEEDIPMEVDELFYCRYVNNQNQCWAAAILLKFWMSYICLQIHCLQLTW